MSIKVIQVLSTTTAPYTGAPISLINEDTRSSTFQATVTGTGSVSATVVIEVSNDTVGWITAADSVITLPTGTTTVSDGFLSTASWAYVRARCTAISGTAAVVTVTAVIGA